MKDILYYAEVEVAQKGDINLKILEDLEDSIFEAIEAFTDEDMLIDEETVIVDDEDGVLILMTEEYDDLDELKTKTIDFLKQTVDESQFDTTLYFYKNEFLEEVEI